MVIADKANYIKDFMKYTGEDMPPDRFSSIDVCWKSSDNRRRPDVPQIDNIVGGGGRETVVGGHRQRYVERRSWQCYTVDAAIVAAGYHTGCWACVKINHKYHIITMVTVYFRISCADFCFVLPVAASSTKSLRSDEAARMRGERTLFMQPSVVT